MIRAATDGEAQARADDRAVIPELDLSEEDQLVKEVARKFATEVIEPRAEEMFETGEFPYDIIEGLKELGLIGILVPEEYGGAGTSTTTYVAALEEIAPGSASSSYTCDRGSRDRGFRSSLSRMRAAWYERRGPAREVLNVGELATPEPGPGEVRLAVRASGVNPGEVKKRADTFGRGIPYTKVIPHSDGAGVIDAVGAGVGPDRIGERVWCYGAQSYRPFGTAAELCVVPSEQAVALPDETSFERGACLGIPGLTAHRCVFAAGEVRGRTVLVQGGAGAVGGCAVQLASQGGARVIGVVRSASQIEGVRRAGASEVVIAGEGLAERIRALAPEGVDHIVEVAFGANVATSIDVLAPLGSIAAYATDVPEPALPFWPLVFANTTIYFLGSDDFPAAAKSQATVAITEALEAGWEGLPIAERFPLDEIAAAHEAVEHPTRPGKVVVLL